jgi:hypothetical protein
MEADKMTPLPSVPNPIPSFTKFVTSFTGLVSEVVQSVHKEAALVLGVLTATGTTPVPTGDQKIVTALLVGYAAVCHLGDNLFKK